MADSRGQPDPDEHSRRGLSGHLGRRRHDGAGLHAGFKLNADGDSLYLFEADGVTRIDSVEFGVQIPNVSYGRYPDGSAEWQFLSLATPGAANVQSL